MHIFLMGESQVGKSTLIKKLVKSLSLIPGGFVTKFVQLEGEKRLFIHHPGKDPQEKQCVARVVQRERIVYPRVFDTEGTTLLEDKSYSLLLMDECGDMESSSFAFQKAVLQALEGTTPILGVIKIPGDGWLKRISHHPKVKVFTVTKENRDQLFEELLPLLQSYIENLSFRI